MPSFTIKVVFAYNNYQELKLRIHNENVNLFSLMDGIRIWNSEFVFIHEGKSIGPLDTPKTLGFTRKTQYIDVIPKPKQ